MLTPGRRLLMPAGVNVPVLVGAVPLFYVQSMNISEGYGIERLLLKKALEAMALTSRLLVAAAAPLLAVTGIPVVSGLTISLDMQITDLRFTQSVAKRDALDVSI